MKLDFDTCGWTQSSIEGLGLPKEQKFGPNCKGSNCPFRICRHVKERELLSILHV